MSDADRGSFIEHQGRQLFNRLLKYNRVSLSGRQINAVLDLQTLIALVPVSSQHAGSVQDRYRQYLYPLTFEHYYKKFSRRYYHKVISGKCPVENCMVEFEKKIVH